MVTNNSNCNMSVLSKLEKALPQNTFFGSQDLSFAINNYTIELDEVTFCLFGYEGKMSLTIQADQIGFHLVKKLLDTLEKPMHFPFNSQLEPNNSQSKLYLQTETDLQIVKYCLENAFKQLNYQQQYAKLPAKIEPHIEYVDNPFI